MGGGSWSEAHYKTASSTRAASGTADFDYTTKATVTHSNLAPWRINSKPFGKLESRDSDEHPASVPVLISFDVTGSNFERAVVAQKKLPILMALLNKYLPDPQVGIAANDDFCEVGAAAVQISDFESDNRVDEHIRSVRLIGRGGANDGESYDLVLYAAARKVALDSVEKRDKKGYLFLYADEPIFKQVSKAQVLATFGDTLQADIPIAEIIEEARRLWNIFVIWPTRGYAHARAQYIELFGDECVVDSQDPNLLCELIASIVGLYESKETPESIVTDLVAVGVSRPDADAVGNALSITKIGEAQLAVSGPGKAARL